jgi:hypothetical protein
VNEFPSSIIAARGEKSLLWLRRKVGTMGSGSLSAAIVSTRNSGTDIEEFLGGNVNTATHDEEIFLRACNSVTLVHRSHARRTSFFS